MNLLIANGRVIDPSQQLDAKLDVLIQLLRDKPDVKKPEK